MTDWRQLLRGSRFEVDGDEVVVRFESGRKHLVRVSESDEVFEIQAVVAKAAAVRDVEGLALRIWRHNRSAQLVSFRIDERGRVRANGWVPRVGVTAEEFVMVLRRVAVEADRLEYLLTGKDTE